MKSLIDGNLFVKLQLLGKRIDNFRKSGENIASTYPNTRSYIEEELQKLVQRWEEFSERAQKSRTSIDLSIAYFKLLDEVKRLDYDFVFKLKLKILSQQTQKEFFFWLEKHN